MTEQAGTDPSHSPGSDPVGPNPTGPEPSARPDPNLAEPSTVPVPDADGPNVSDPTAPGEPAAPEPIVSVLPKPRRRPVRWIVLASVFVVLLAVTVTAIVVTRPARVTAFTANPATLIKAGTAELAAARVVRYRGTYLGAVGQPVRLDGIVTSSGDSLLDLHLATGGHAQIVTHQRTHLVLGDHAWWLAQFPNDSANRADHWSEDGSGLNTDLFTLLDPRQLAETLRFGLTGRHASASSRAGSAYRAASIGGSRVAAVPTPSHTTVYVSEQQPFHIRGLDGPLLSAIGADSAPEKADVETAPQVTFDVTIPGAAQRKALGRRVTDTWATAKDAEEHSSDSVAEFLLSRSDLQCDEQRCTVTASVRRESPGPAQPARVLFVGVLSTDRDAHHTVGFCDVLSKPMAINHSARMSCQVGTSGLDGYSGLVYSHLSALAWTDVGASPKEVAAVIDKGLFEATADPILPIEAYLVTNSWTRSDWKVGEVAQVINTACAEKVLPPLYRLDRSGKFRFEPKPLMELLDAAGSAPGGREWDALQEAARRSGKTTGTVSVGSWRSGGRTFHADVIDTGAKESVQIAAVRSDADLSASRRQIAGAAGRFTGDSTPSGYHRVLQVVLAPGHQLYRSDRAGVRAGLRAAGLSAKQLNGARLTVVGQHGTSTFTAADFR